MSDSYFLDTNILVYSHDPSDERKRAIAEELIARALRDGRGMISFQVVQEFCSAALRKFATRFTSVELREYFEVVLAPLCHVHSHPELYRTCLNIIEQTGYSLYDALILAAAATADCGTLYTEDLQHGQTVAGVKIVNPF